MLTFRSGLKNAKKYADIKVLASEARRFFKNLGLGIGVQVVKDISRFDPNSLKKNDGVVVIGGSRKQVANYVAKNLKSITSDAFKMDLPGWVSRIGLNPETTDGGGNVIVINAAELGATGVEFGNENANTTGGFIVVHGAGHLAGLGDFNGNQFSDSRGKYLLYGGDMIRSMINNESISCPRCLNDFTTDPSPILIEFMTKRFAKNKLKN